jgi:hypothetical protein
MDGDAALAQIAEWRHSTPDGWKRSPETEEQWQMVQKWTSLATSMHS